MALNYSGFSQLPIQFPGGTQLLPNNPGSLNTFMVQNDDYTANDDVSWDRTVPDVAWRALGGPSSFHWDSTKAGLTDIGGAERELDNILCGEQVPVIVGVNI